jgi:hypothetical protein
VFNVTSGHAERVDAASSDYRFQVVDIIGAAASRPSATAATSGAGSTLAIRVAYPPG